MRFVLKTLKLRLTSNVEICKRKISAIGKITNCNGQNACGDPNFTAAICAKESCGIRSFNMFERRRPSSSSVSLILMKDMIPVIDFLKVHVGHFFVPTLPI